MSRIQRPLDTLVIFRLIIVLSLPCPFPFLVLSHPCPFPFLVLSLPCPFPFLVLSLPCPFPSVSFPFHVLSLPCPFLPCPFLSCPFISCPFLSCPFPSVSFPFRVLFGCLVLYLSCSLISFHFPFFILILSLPCPFPSLFFPFLFLFPSLYYSVLLSLYINTFLAMSTRPSSGHFLSIFFTFSFFTLFHYPRFYTNFLFYSHQMEFYPLLWSYILNMVMFYIFIFIHLISLASRYTVYS